VDAVLDVVVGARRQRRSSDRPDEKQRNGEQLREPNRRCAEQAPKSGTKKNRGYGPRSNNDKRRMVPRRHSQPRTVKTDSGFSGEFENFFDSLTGIFARPTEASQTADSDKFGQFQSGGGPFLPARFRVALPPRFLHRFHLYRPGSAPGHSPLQIVITVRAEPSRAGRFPRDGSRRGRLRCCCPRPGCWHPCLAPTDAPG
jgi:hypothetical protein